MQPRSSGTSSPDSGEEHCSTSDCVFEKEQSILCNPDDQPARSTNHGQELPSPEQQNEPGIVPKGNRRDAVCSDGV